MASEEAKVVEAENSTEVLTAFNRIPYALINAEIDGSAKDTLDELTRICKYYKVYKKGASFTVEGSNGDYVPATLKYKMAASLINKEARFLFAEPPDITVEPKGDVGKITDDAKNALTVLNDLVKTVLDKNNFEEALIEARRIEFNFLAGIGNLARKVLQLDIATLQTVGPLLGRGIHLGYALYGMDTILGSGEE